MTYDDVIVKTLLTVGVLVATSVVDWMFPALAVVGSAVAFIIGLFAIFKKNPSAALTLAYAAFEGLALGGKPHAGAFCTGSHAVGLSSRQCVYPETCVDQVRTAG